MKHFLAGVLTLALLCPLALGDALVVPPRVTGDTSTLTVVNKFPLTLEAPAGCTFHVWTVPAGVKSSTSGGTLSIESAPRGTYLVKYQCLKIDFEAKTVQEYVGTVTLSVGDTPTPGPGPGPGPDPKPQPDGEFGLIKASREGMAAVSSASKSEEAVALARAQRAHAAAVAAGAFASPKAITDGWVEANKKALSDTARAAWTPWALAVSKQFEFVFAAGKLKGNTEWAAAFNEMADGLSAGGKK